MAVLLTDHTSLGFTNPAGPEKHEAHHYHNIVHYFYKYRSYHLKAPWAYGTWIIMAYFNKM